MKTKLSFFFLLVAAFAAAQANPVREWRQANERQILAEFTQLLAMPNLASDAAAIKANADALVAALEKRGVKARLLDGAGGPPPVYGELLTPGAQRTLLFYAHYDGQPVNRAQWKSEPWQPVLRDASGNDVTPTADQKLDPEWRIYARSAGDDKGGIMAILAALDAVAATGKKPAVNLKFFLEGEEEAGSSHLDAVLQQNAALFAADAMILVDGPVHQTRRMQVFFGARGVMGLELTVYGPTRALHSGHYGNWAQNPASMLANLLASMRAPDGRILVKDFYKPVRPLSPAEQRALAAMPNNDAALLHDLGLNAPEGEAGLATAIMKPALNIRGIQAGGVGDAAANAIATTARASIDFRLVPDQTPDLVRNAIEAHIRQRGFHIVTAEPDAATRRAHPRIVKLEWEGGYAPHRTPMDTPIAAGILQALDRAADQPVIRVPTLGGSVPMSIFDRHLKMPIIGVPIANHDNNQHAANENLRLQNLWDGIEYFAALMTDKH